MVIEASDVLLVLGYALFFISLPWTYPLISPAVDLSFERLDYEHIVGVPSRSDRLTMIY